MKSELVVSLFALAFAMVSFVLSFAQTMLARRAEIRPVVAIVYSEHDGWVVRNIGGGPAMNIVVAYSWDEKVSRRWGQPVRIPPLAVGSEFALKWIGHSNVRAIASSYTDFEGRKYSSVCENDLSQLVEGDTLPDWPSAEISRHWWEAEAAGNRGDRRRFSGR